MNDVAPAIPAATVILVRDAPALEVLMLKRTSKGSFGGMWVFPGGRVDPGDRHPDDAGDEPAARRAAVREAEEECGLSVEAGTVVPFSRWTPPAITPKRFATWFFLTRVPHGDVVVDGGEILDHRWLAPAEVLSARDRGEVDLAPPTWMTLNELAASRQVDEALTRAVARPLVHYVTRWCEIDGGAVAMWHGDAGYDTGDAHTPGPRHRLWMLQDGWRAEIG